MPAKTKKPIAPEIAQSMTQAEKLFGVSKAVQIACKASGCVEAFKAQRVHKKPLLAWVRQNPKAVAAAELAADERQSESAMKRQRLAIAIEHAQLDLDAAKGLLTTVVESDARYIELAAIVQEEAKLLMEPDHFRIWIERIRARLTAINNAFEQVVEFCPGLYRWDGRTLSSVPTKPAKKSS